MPGYPMHILSHMPSGLTSNTYGPTLRRRSVGQAHKLEDTLLAVERPNNGLGDVDVIAYLKSFNVQLSRNKHKPWQDTVQHLVRKTWLRFERPYISIHMYLYHLDEDSRLQMISRRCHS